MVMLEVTGPVPAAVIRQHDDGRVEVLDGPRLAEFSLEMLATPGLPVFVDEAGNLSLAGQVIYRPVRFRQDLGGHITLICQRVN